MKKLAKSPDGLLIVRPRWPYRYVHISVDAYDRLLEAQSLLAKDGIRLAVTRGLEQEGWVRKTMHRFARKVGAALFRLLYPARQHEAAEIFCANGHDTNASCVDVGIVRNNHTLKLLPCGVFTTARQRRQSSQRHHATLMAVKSALQACGFTIHPNPTEALQIHCEC